LNPSTGKPVSAKWLFESAESFNNGANALEAARRSDIHSKHIGDLTLCRLVLKSFTVELYLKSLLAEEFGTVPITHDLYELFRQLPRNTKATLRKRHLHLAVNDDFLVGLHESGFIVSLDTLLKINKDAFEQYRYIHEGKAKSAFLLEVFINCARQYILERHPDWSW
jgi:hypothetical protein